MIWCKNMVVTIKTHLYPDMLKSKEEGNCKWLPIGTELLARALSTPRSLSPITSVSPPLTSSFLKPHSRHYPVQLSGSFLFPVPPRVFLWLPLVDFVLPSRAEASFLGQFILVQSIGSEWSFWLSLILSSFSGLLIYLTKYHLSTY